MNEIFNTLNSVDVNNKVEKKNNLTYLSWAWAWAEVKKRFPNANYVIKKFGNYSLPYVFDEKTGYMVFTQVTIDEITHEMWLPVMDHRNKTLMNATMFDINKTIMRCLTKNLAMHGLGLYIYAGEDLPEKEEPAKEKLPNWEDVKEVPVPTNNTKLEKKHFAALNIEINKRQLTKEEAKILTKDMFNKESAKDLTMEEFRMLMNEIQKIPLKEGE